MALTVLLTGYALAPVGPDAVGGTEQVVTALDRALVAAGHRSLVVACDGSVVQGRHFPFTAPHAHISDADREAAREDLRAAVATAMASESVDLVHMHGLDFPWCLPPPGVPVLATLHLPPDWYPPWTYTLDRPATWLNCVSGAQCRAAPEAANMLPPVSNGVPVHDLAAERPAREGYALCLARICPEKGLHLALDAAHRADIPLLIAGDVFPYETHERYFADEIAPRLDARRRYLGPVGFAEKRRLLARARCLLIPSLVAETSSLVAMEAAACGAPVIAFPIGALPEVVEHGRTGVLVPDRDAMAAALGTVGQVIESETCRAVARERFTIERMTAAYLARYDALAGRAAAAA